MKVRISRVQRGGLFQLSSHFQLSSSAPGVNFASSFPPRGASGRFNSSNRWKDGKAEENRTTSMSTGSKGSGGHLSNTSAETNGNHSDGDDLDQSKAETTDTATTSNADPMEAWWSVGEFLDGRQVTHQSAKLTLTGNRVFTNNQNEEMWDLTDSLAELYEVSQKFEAASTLQLTSRRTVRNEQKDVDIQDWLGKDSTHGFIRVYPSDGSQVYARSQLVPCTVSTSAHKICLVLGISINALHVQLNGDIIRRLDPYEHPLVLQNEYLGGIGFSDLRRIQQEGACHDLGYLVRFFSGKPSFDSTFSRNQLQAFIDVKKGKVMSQWTKRLCVLSGTRLLTYKDRHKKSPPSVFQLAKGAVEEFPMKGHDRVLKVTSTLQGEKVIFLSFHEKQDHDKWFRKFKKATDKLPTAADLSHCHLEFLPETIFINDQLAMLNLRHNVLKERPIDEDIYTIGWLDDLPRFTRLRSLNLADNNLSAFPLAVCYIKTLVELNVASNKLEELPPEIGELSNLQALHVHNNHLSTLPPELVSLRKLFILVLAFNRFTAVPPVVAQMTDVRVSEVENIIMAGNQIESLSAEVLTKMKYVKKVDFRMNKLTLSTMETMKFPLLEHLTHLDIRDNDIPELDIRPIRTLEYLNVERNTMTSLQLNGMQIKNLFAAHNVLERLVVTPKPEWLLQADFSHNNLRRIPDWLSDCFFLQKLNVSYNLLIELPSRLLVDAKKLKSLRVNHNRLVGLPPEVDLVSLEELYLQHNNITRLPHDLLRKSNKLRVLNATKNRLSMLPPLNENQDLNKVQELYLTSNCLGDAAMETISGYTRLKVLHLADNEIHNLHAKDLRRLDVLQELNVSTNQLRTVPDMLGEMPRLVVLRAHSNVLQNLPDLKQAKALRILDVGHNQLLNVSVTNLMASQIDMLDMSLNAQLRVDPREFRTIKHKKSICLVDLTGQNRLLPGLVHRRPRIPTEEEETDPATAWKVGFSETSGMRNKLCIATLKILKFRNENEAVFGMFDGGHNNEVPKLLLDSMAEILQDELNHGGHQHDYMKYAMLAAHRKLKGAGQRLGASVAVCHLTNESSPRASQIHHKRYTLQLGNVGDIEVVLCRRGEATLLSHCHITTADREECARVYRTDGIITEDSKVNGTTKNTRLLGVSYLYPHVVPDPYTCTVALRQDDEFVIVANRGLWKFVGYNEAVQEIYEIGNPVVAAKKLQDLAQGYGSKENIGVLVVRFNTDQGPSLARLRQHRSMSIDDIEAAALFEIRRQKQVENAAKLRASTGKLVDAESSEEKAEKRPCTPPPPPPPPANFVNDENSQPLMDTAPRGSGLSNEFAKSTTIDNSPKGPDNRSQKVSRKKTPAPPPPMPEDLKPLPKQKFRKKNIASEWEGILQKRLTNDVKDKELKQLGRSVSEESIFGGDNEMHAVSIDLDGPDGMSSRNDVNIETRAMKRETGTLRKRMMTPPWYHQVENTATATYGLSDGAKPAVVDKRPKVRKTIAMFENMGKPEDEEEDEGDEVPDEVTMNGTVSKRTTVVTLERDERSPLNNQNGHHSDLSTPKVEIQTLETVKGEAMQEVNGSVERNLYSGLRKVTKKDQNHNSEPTIDPNDEVTIVEIARL